LCTFAIDHALGGGEALPFKATSVLLHAATAWTLLALLLAHGAHRAAATLAALLFAVHPLASEAVDMVSARSEVLCVLGLLLAMRGHLAWIGGRAAGAAATALGALIACGSKETGVVLPVLLLWQELLRAGVPRTGAAWRRGGCRLLPALAVV